MNDRFGGEPVAVTWCPLVQAGVAFESEVDVSGTPTVLILQASGKLWRDALVLWDKQTKSLIDLNGAAMSVGGDPVFAHALPGGKSAKAWYRAPEGSNELYALSLSDDGKQVLDAERGLAWDAFDGRSLEEGVADLRGIENSKVVYYFAWHQNHPAGRVWAGASYVDPRDRRDAEASKGDAAAGSIPVEPTPDVTKATDLTQVPAAKTDAP